MTSPANEMHIFLWQIGTVIPIQSMITYIYVPCFQPKSLTIAIVCGNYFRVLPRNLIFGVTYSTCSAKADFPLSKVETAFWCSFSRVPNWRLDWPKYSFLQSPHGIDYRIYSMSFLICFNRIFWLCENMT
jgi:hypothetical protein